MIDILTFVPNLNVFRQALKDSDSEFVTLDENGDVVLLIDRIPIKINGNKTLSLCRCSDAQKTFLESISAVDIIGEDQGGIDFVFYNSGRNKYDQVYDRTPVETPFGTYTPPLKIGVFA